MNLPTTRRLRRSGVRAPVPRLAVLTVLALVATIAPTASAGAEPVPASGFDATGERTSAVAAAGSLFECEVEDDDVDELLDRRNDACPTWVGEYRTGRDHDRRGPGSIFWEEGMRYNTPHVWGNTAPAVAPDGGLYFDAVQTVTYDSDFAFNERVVHGVAAFRTDDGSVAWQTNYQGTDLEPQSRYTPRLAISPDGSTVYLADTTTTPDGSSGHAVVVAFDADNGDLLWESRPITAVSLAQDIAVSAVSDDGILLALTGYAVEEQKMVTAVLDAGSGATRWVHAAGPDAVGAPAPAIGTWGYRVVAAPELSSEPDQPAFYVAGSALHRQSGFLDSGDQVTAAYGPTGQLLWSHIYRRDGGQNVNVSNFGPDGLGITPDGDRLVYTARVVDRPGDGNPAGVHVVAIDTVNGREVWDALVDEDGTGYFPRQLAMDPSGETVYLTFDDSGAVDTVAYRVSDGEELWAVQWIGPRRNFGWSSMVLNAAKAQVHVAGTTNACCSTVGQQLAAVDTCCSIAGQVWAAVTTYDADSGDRLAINRYGDWKQQVLPNQLVKEWSANFTGMGVTADGRQLFITAQYRDRDPADPAFSRTFTQVVAYDTPR